MGVEEYLKRGNWLYRQGEFRKALDLHQRAVALEPDNVQLMAAVARDWLALNEPKKALWILSQANRLAPDYQYARRMLLYIQKLLGLPQELAELKPASAGKRARPSPTPFMRGAEEYSQPVPSTREPLQRLEETRRSSYRRPTPQSGLLPPQSTPRPPRSTEISLTPPVVRPLDDAGIVRLTLDAYELLRQRRPIEALTIVRQLVAQAPNNAYAHYLLGYALDTLRHYGKAAYSYQMAIANGRTTGRIAARLERVRYLIEREQGGV